MIQLFTVQNLVFPGVLATHRMLFCLLSAKCHCKTIYRWRTFVAVIVRRLSLQFHHQYYHHICYNHYNRNYHCHNCCFYRIPVSNLYTFRVMQIKKTDFTSNTILDENYCVKSVAGELQGQVIISTVFTFKLLTSGANWPSISAQKYKIFDSGYEHHTVLWHPADQHNK